MSMGAEEQQKRIEILAVLPHEEDRMALGGILAHSNWTVHATATIAETRKWLEHHPAPVILCERDLPDGTWQDLFEAVAISSPAPNLVVTSRLADDHLWCEVLNLGGFDVLARPFAPAEVFRVLYMAWRNWHDRAQIARMAPLTAPPSASGLKCESRM